MPAKIDKYGDVFAYCEVCGKPLTVVNEYGMFCDEMHQYEESVKCRERLDEIIFATVEAMNNIDDPINKEKLLDDIQAIINHEKEHLKYRKENKR
jgi:hypothetical protein